MVAVNIAEAWPPASARGSSRECCRRDQLAVAVVMIQASTRASSRQAS